MQKKVFQAEDIEQSAEENFVPKQEFAQDNLAVEIDFSQPETEIEQANTDIHFEPPIAPVSSRVLFYSKVRCC